MRRRFRAALVVTLALARPAAAQPSLTSAAIGAEFAFYGDNTEFANPFREGETIFGVQGRIFADVTLSPRTTVRLGVFGNQRFGAEHGFSTVRPVLTLIVTGAGNRFLFGALDTGAFRAAGGPDLDGPHGLLPPIQRETLSFSRGYEAGIQWTHTGARERHDGWINWQKLNTPGQRELFDAGFTARARVAGPVHAALHTHIVHHGGQLFADGPVADSGVFGPGVVVNRAVGRVDAFTAEAFGLRSFYRPDRAMPDLTRSGIGGLIRVAVEKAGWRGHAIAWRGCDFIKEEGDPNYGSLRRDGTRVRQTRDYAEAGVTRRYLLTPTSTLEASARLHRVEAHYEYSYRIVARVRARWAVR
jgi:hypothetical protein